MQLWIK